MVQFAGFCRATSHSYFPSKNILAKKIFLLPQIFFKVPLSSSFEGMVAGMENGSQKSPSDRCDGKIDKILSHVNSNVVWRKNSLKINHLKTEKTNFFCLPLEQLWDPS